MNDRLWSIAAMPGFLILRLPSLHTRQFGIGITNPLGANERAGYAAMKVFELDKNILPNRRAHRYLDESGSNAIEYKRRLH